MTAAVRPRRPWAGHASAPARPIPLREIARRLGISRNTVRRYPRSEITEPSYAERHIASGLDKYSLQLSGWLKSEASKPRKQRRNLKQLHAELQELGYQTMASFNILPHGCMQIRIVQKRPRRS
ncbi:MULTISPECIES: hypothetical protein [unclassified Duganella]|jgi:transcriptional regulator with XRE-family HTH domain|uniref:hypothetical protein n=1 Tax=unclassified Duganella TaxID=2636909 RepID=UPI001113D197|nr:MULTISPECIES: hypothetical protein [unclassified Duganella]